MRSQAGRIRLSPFSRGLLRQSPAVLGWVGILVIVNGIVPLFFLSTLEGRVVLITLMVGGVLMEVLTWAQGFTRLLGLGHVLWLGLVPWLWLRLEQHASGTFTIWLGAVIVCNVISLAFDVRDVALYLGGDRAETVSTSS
jgi:hypothetical protein